MVYEETQLISKLISKRLHRSYRDVHNSSDGKVCGFLGFSTVWPCYFSGHDFPARDAAVFTYTGPTQKLCESCAKHPMSVPEGPVSRHGPYFISND